MMMSRRLDYYVREIIDRIEFTSRWGLGCAAFGFWMSLSVPTSAQGRKANQNFAHARFGALTYRKIYQNQFEFRVVAELTYRRRGCVSLVFEESASQARVESRNHGV